VCFFSYFLTSANFNTVLRVLFICPSISEPIFKFIHGPDNSSRCSFSEQLSVFILESYIPVPISRSSWFLWSAQPLAVSNICPFLSYCIVSFSRSFLSSAHHPLWRVVSPPFPSIYEYIPVLSVYPVSRLCIISPPCYCFEQLPSFPYLLFLSPVLQVPISFANLLLFLTFEQRYFCFCILNSSCLRSYHLPLIFQYFKTYLFVSQVLYVLIINISYFLLKHQPVLAPRRCTTLFLSHLPSASAPSL
jgi:hypothetical protein